MKEGQLEFCSRNRKGDVWIEILVFQGSVTWWWWLWVMGMRKIEEVKKGRKLRGATNIFNRFDDSNLHVAQCHFSLCMCPFLGVWDVTFLWKYSQASGRMFHSEFRFHGDYTWRLFLFVGNSQSNWRDRTNTKRRQFIAKNQG